MSESSTVLIERHDEVAVLIFNRPDKLNAFNLEFFDTLPRRAQEIRDDETIRAVVITGAGRAFSVGADLSPDEQARLRATRAERQKRTLQTQFESSTGWPQAWLGLTLPVPV